MNLSEDNNQPENEAFGAEWRRVFDEAAETPPEQVWNAIERQLDEDDRGAVVIPFWSRMRPLAYGMAAAVALLLLGWWAFQRNDQQPIDNAQSVAVAPPESAQSEAPPGPTNIDQPTPATNERIADTPTPRPGGSSEKEDHTTAIAENSQDRIAAQRPTKEHRADEMPETLKANPSVVAQASPDQATPRSTAGEVGSTQPVAATPPPALPTGERQTAFTTPPATVSERLKTIAPQPANRVSVAVSNPTEAESRMAIAAEQPINESIALSPAAYDRLTGKPLRLTSKSGIDRIVWYRAPEAEPVIEPQRSSKKQFWTALAFVPTSFNPGASVRAESFTPAPGFSAMGPSVAMQRSVNEVELRNQPQLSVTLQLNTGMKLAEHWSLETGINYLEARSQVRSNAVVVTGVASIFAQNNKTSNLFENAVLNSSNTNRSYSLPAADALLTNAVADQSAITNNYRFVQVPLQAGYHIRPRRKLSYTLLGGFLANLFLRNSVGALEVVPSDQIYRPVTLSGTAGVRLSYRPTRRWSGSLTGSFQQALQSGTRPDAYFQTRPQAVGAGFGVNYHF